MLKSAHTSANQGGGALEQRQKIGGGLFIAHQQFAEAIEPRVRAFHHPAAGAPAFAARVAGGRCLVCLLGALAAAPGSVAMLAHRLIAFRSALARWRFRFQAGVEFFPFAWSHHFHVGDVRSA
jgi:hypothetical protein